MKWKSILSRVRGLSVGTRGIGISWDPPRAEANIVQDLFAFLEDRRVLFDHVDLEVPEYCARSVLEIRQHLTMLLRQMPNTLGLSQHLRVLRAACRRFLTAIQEKGTGHLIVGNMFDASTNQWRFLIALGELRATFGTHLAILAVRYHMGIEGDLATILPPPPDRDELTK